MTRPLTHPLVPDLDIDPDFDIDNAITPQLAPSRRADGWTAARQRAFCESVANGQTVENAAREVGLSPSSAYAFRNSAKGSAFAIGWTAAQLLQRQRLADVVASRAFAGQTVTVTRPDGETVERHFFDNRLAMSVLTRLDRLAAGQVAPGAGPSAPAAEVHAARLAAGEWDRYLDLLADNATPARAGLFLAARTAGDAAPGTPELAAITALARADLYDRTRAGVPAEIITADLDVARRAEWTAEQWARAEAAGLLSVTAPPARETTTDSSPPHSQHSPQHAPQQSGDQAADDEPFWWCPVTDAWRTSFPPPDDFCGNEEGEFGDADYERDLTEEETAILDHASGHASRDRAAAAAERDAWLAALAGDRHEQEEDGDEHWDSVGYDNGYAAEDWIKVTPPDEAERAAAPAVETP